MTIFINKEMRALIPPLSEEEFEQLEKNIIAEGIRDPLVTWPQPDGREMLIDGHNRYDISLRHNGIPFKVVRKEFADMDEAKVWVIHNQLGRRNIHDLDRAKLLEEERKIEVKKSQDRHGYRSDLHSDFVEKFPQSGKTRDIMGSKMGVSGKQYDKLKAINEKATDKTKQLVREGKLSINQAYNSVHEKRPDPVKQAKEAHERFEESKAGGVVDFKAAQVDKINQQIINDALYQEFLKFIVQVNDFVLIHTVKELEAMIDNIPDDERSYYGQQIGDCMTALGTIRAKIEWRNHGRN